MFTCEVPRSAAWVKVKLLAPALTPAGGMAISEPGPSIQSQNPQEF